MDSPSRYVKVSGKHCNTAPLLGLALVVPIQTDLLLPEIQCEVEVRIAGDQQGRQITPRTSRDAGTDLR